MTNTTWDSGSISAVTLSGGNLVATNTGTTSTNQGANAPAADTHAAGKYYFEFTLTTLTGGGGVGVGVATPTSTFTGVSTLSQHGVVCFVGTGNIWVDVSGNTGFSLGARSSGNVICVALDVTNGRIWFRAGAAGSWTSGSPGDPTQADGAHGGFGLPTGYGTSGLIPFVTFGSGLSGPAGASGNIVTANFGDSAFTGAVPTGYTSGWPVAGTLVARISQVAVEEWADSNPNAQITQLAVEQWVEGTAGNRGVVTQVAVEEWGVYAAASTGRKRRQVSVAT